MLLTTPPLLSLLLTAWRVGALAAELLLVGTHLKVLLCVGRPYSSAELASKRWSYFLADALSPWNSLLSAALAAAAAAPLAGPGLGSASAQQGSSPLGDGRTTSSFAAWLVPLLVPLALGHAALHAFYIATWRQAHARNVIAMSASPDMRSRWQRFRGWEVVWFLVGTSCDIATHAAIAGVLAWQMLPSMVTLHSVPLAHAC